MAAKRRKKRYSAPKMACALVPPILVQIVERPSLFEASSGRIAASQLPLSADPDPVQTRTRPFGSIKTEPVPAAAA